MSVKAGLRFRVGRVGCVVAVLAAAGAGIGRAQTRWIGPDGESWSEGANWDNNVPTALADAFVGHAGGASPVSAVITQNVQAVTKSLTVGDSTVGTLHMNGDRLDINGNLNLGITTAGATGTVVQTAGTVAVVFTAANVDGDFYINSNNRGVYLLNGGTLEVGNRFWIREERNRLEIAPGAKFVAVGNARYDRDVTFLSGVTYEFLSRIQVPYTLADTWITANHYATFGSANDAGPLSIATTADNTLGEVNVLGGLMWRRRVDIALRSGCHGILNVRSNTAVRIGNYSATGRFWVGENGGVGEVNLGDAASLGWIEWTAVNRPQIRRDAASSATIRGVGGFRDGTLAATEVFDMSGRVIADGWGGAERDLEVFHIPALTNGIPNGVNESNGWYAVRGARLLLPSPTVAAGDNSYNWGEHSGETEIDLVNSARFEFTGVTTGGWLTNALLAVDRGDVPQRSQLDRPVAVHHVTCDAALDFGSLTLTFRYDSIACAEAGYAEPVVLHSSGGAWQELPAALDAANRRISVTLTELSGSDFFGHAAGRIYHGSLLTVR